MFNVLKVAPNVLTSNIAGLPKRGHKPTDPSNKKKQGCLGFKHATAFKYILYQRKAQKIIQKLSSNKINQKQSSTLLCRG